MLPEETQRPIGESTLDELEEFTDDEVLSLMHLYSHISLFIHHGPHVEFFFQFWRFQIFLDVHIIEIYKFGVAWKGVIIHVYECTFKKVFFFRFCFAELFYLTGFPDAVGLWGLPVQC